MSDHQRLQFNEWIFDTDFSIARGGDAPPIRFTRQEQAVLRTLVRKPGQLVSREQLLDSLDPNCDGVGERSVDFLVNRLRRKLRDDARRPRFIGTRYGEGYLWLVKGRRVDESFTLLRVESVYGLTHLSSAEIGTTAVRALTTQLGERLHWRCVMPPSLGLTHPLASGECDARLHMDISVFDDVSHLHVAASFRNDRTGNTLATLTRHLPLESAVDAMAELAASLAATLWSLLIPEQRGTEAPTAQPLHLRAQEAGLLLTRSPEYWREIEPQILKWRQENPGDSRLAVLWALNRHARLLSSCSDDGAETTRLIAEYQSCVESDVLRAVPALADSPAYQLTASMLLLTLPRDHTNIAEELIERALWNGGAFASVFSARALLSLCRGDLSEAIAYLDRAVEMAVSGSEFHVYLLVLKLKAQIAGGKRAEAIQLKKALFAIKPQTAVNVGFHSADPDGDPGPAVLEMLQTLGLQRVRQLLRHFFYMAVRPMTVREHRFRLMLGPIVHARRRFGSEVIADDILADLPELVDA